ncbi:MAG: hypothetical protein WA919_05280 [Coleofasciculaceae cyanobacterium]
MNSIKKEKEKKLPSQAKTKLQRLEEDWNQELKPHTPQTIRSFILLLGNML